MGGLVHDGHVDTLLPVCWMPKYPTLDFDHCSIDSLAEVSLRFGNRNLRLLVFQRCRQCQANKLHGNLRIARVGKLMPELSLPLVPGRFANSRKVPGHRSPSSHLPVAG